MAKRAAEFAEFVASLSADDKELTADLKAAEQVTERSAQAMQSSLDRVRMSAGSGARGMGDFRKSVDSVGASSQVSSRAVSALGATASVTGSQFAATATQFAAFAAASDELALSLTGVEATGAAALKVLGPIALAAGAVGLALKALTGIAKEHNRVIDEARAKHQTLRDTLTEELEVQRQQFFVQTGMQTQLEADLKRVERTTALKRGAGGPTPENETYAQSMMELRFKRRIVKAQHELLALKKQEAEADARVQRHRSAVLRHRQLELGVIRRQFNERKQMEAEQRRAAAVADAAAEQRLNALSQKLESVQQQRIGAAQSLLVSLGAAKPSEFIEDPMLQRIAALGESLSGGERAPLGSFGLERIRSPLAAVRGGEALGRQTLTTAEQQKQLTQQELIVIGEVRDILRRFETKSLASAGSGNMPFVLTEGPG